MSSAPDLQRVESIFHAALEQRDLVARERYLAETCGDDDALAAEVKRLLGAEADAQSGFLASPGLDRQRFAQAMPGEMPGACLGPYRLVEELGHGGFGTVWLAEQATPVRRKVALKIIKLGMDTRELVARFAQEQQALALMDHPHIAKVHDAGATDTGRPFFVMELVRGLKITDYCDQHALPLRARLELFCQVCAAVQHAHQNGIIHRDLKPSNILITENGVPAPKIIDFGVAKAMQQRLTELTVFTQAEQMIGTPHYMSPEQARNGGQGVDSRTDIYSLGVLLYELLTGRTPFQLGHDTRHDLAEACRIIREQEPSRPSTALSTMEAGELAHAASARSSEPPRLIGAVKGDLDWIAMKALEKDRARRYATPASFAADIQRYLACEPVTARPPSTLYQFRKLVRRNKVACTAVAAVLSVLLIGIVATSRQAARANSALYELRAAAPSFAEQARALVTNGRIEEAIEKLDYAVKLQPENAEYLLKKADLLESQLKLTEAAEVYRAALRLDPDNARAKTNAKLCEEIVRKFGRDGSQLGLQSLASLFELMTSERRTAAELVTVGTLLNRDREHILAQWRERLKDLPIPPERPLEQRLSMGTDGLLTLNLVNTPVSNLSPLKGMPLGALHCEGCRELSDLSALSGMPLRRLDISRTEVRDLSPVSSLRNLEWLNVSGSNVIDLGPLRGLPLRSLSAAGLDVAELTALEGLPLEELEIEYLPVWNLKPLRGMPLRRLSLDRILAHDFEPLRGLPLEYLSARNIQPNNLGFLEGMPLRQLFLTFAAFEKLNEFPFLSKLEVLSLPNQCEWNKLSSFLTTLRAHDNLRRVGVELEGDRGDGLLPVAEFWQEAAGAIGPFSAPDTGGAKLTKRRFPDGTWALTIQELGSLNLGALLDRPISFLSIADRDFVDLTPLAGQKLKKLHINKTKVTDLSPLRGMPLVELHMNEVPVTDLSPLSDAPLERLRISRTHIADITPLEATPLRVLDMTEALRITDVSALARIATLEEVVLPPHARNIERLRELPRLLTICFGTNSEPKRHPAQQFWGDSDARKEEWVYAWDCQFDVLQKRIRAHLPHLNHATKAHRMFALATALLAGGDLQEYREVCATMRREYLGSDVALTLLACVLSPDSAASADEIRMLTDAALAQGQSDAARPIALSSAVLGEYRLGRYGEAEALLREFLEIRKLPDRYRAFGRAMLALLRAAKNDFWGATTELREVRNALDTRTDNLEELRFWDGWVAIELLMKEAESQIAKGAVPTSDE